ncbi:hypothetical protein [Anatilimnocola floriformis]|uniref:hypothetical protein n=1 Tax=Anatilimnocola floriformis TaxID=2948575 RepID=UPI0020C51683|nr:hypothetical protein [Anatilimnocola floriformis]
MTTWIEKHSTWKSTETHRGVISVVLAAFNRAEEMFGVMSPLKGLKKPAPKPKGGRDRRGIYRKSAC